MSVLRPNWSSKVGIDLVKKPRSACEKKEFKKKNVGISQKSAYCISKWIHLFIALFGKKIQF